MRRGISIIIPALNEAGQIGATLDSLHPSHVLEIIVVDGGSRDGTQDIVRAKGAKLIETAPGRARQMNIGAAEAEGSILLFVHADTLMPRGFDRAVDELMSDPSASIGSFQIQLNGPGWGLRLIGRVVNLRTKFLKAPYGDQSLFVRAEDFEAVGGYPEVPIMEDVILTQRLRKIGRLVTAPQKVLTSARRWHKLGLVRTTLLNWTIVVAYALGVSPERLSRWYKRGKLVKVRAHR